MTATQGTVLDVTAQPLGSELATDAAAAATTLTVDFGSDFDENGGTVRVGGDDPAAELVAYLGVANPYDADDGTDADYLDPASPALPPAPPAPPGDPGTGPTVLATNQATVPRVLAFAVTGQIGADPTVGNATAAASLGMDERSYGRQTITSAPGTQNNGLRFRPNPDAIVGGTTLPNPQNAVAVTPGGTVRICWWWRITLASAAATSARMSYRFADEAGNWIAAQVVGPGIATPNGQWTLVDQTIAVPAGATRFAWVWNTTATAAQVGIGDTADIADILISTDGYTGGYFDGWSAECQWTGAQNASASQLLNTTPDNASENYVGSSVISLATPLVHAWPAGTRVDMWDLGTGAPSVEWRALVAPAGAIDSTDSIDARLDYAVISLLPEGTRDPGAGELVSVDDETGEWVVLNVTSRVPAIDGSLIAPGTIDEDSLSFTAGGTTVTISPTAPSGPADGDIWYDQSNGYKMMEYDGSTSSWVPRQYGTLALADNAASRVTIGSLPPTDPRISDLWVYVDLNGGMQMFRYDPNFTDPESGVVGWQALVFNTPAIAAADIAAENILVGTLSGHYIHAGQFTGTIGGDADNPTALQAVSIGSIADDGANGPVPPNQPHPVGSVFTIDNNGGELDIYYQPSSLAPTVVQLTTGSQWTCPANVNKVTIECWGAGGGGGAISQAGGGGGEYAAHLNVPITPNKTYNYTLGKGGTGGQRSPVTGAQDGTNTQFVRDNGLTTTAHGGSGGAAGQGGHGFGGSGSGAQVHYNGGDGATQDQTIPNNGGGGGGSAGPTKPGISATNYVGAAAVSPGPSGKGGGGGQGAASGIAGSSPGGGGGGAGKTGSNGGNGTDGMIQLTYYTTDVAPPLVASITKTGIKIWRPDLIGFIGGYYEEVNPNPLVVSTGTGADQKITNVTPVRCKNDFATDVLGGQGDFEVASGGWDTKWTAYSGSIAPARQQTHAYNPATGSDLAGGALSSLRLQAGAGSTAFRYAAVSLLPQCIVPGDYVINARVYVPSSAPSDQGLAIYVNNTQVQIVTTPLRNQWAPIQLKFTVPVAATDVSLYAWAQAGVNAANVEWLDAVTITPTQMQGTAWDMAGGVWTCPAIGEYEFTVGIRYAGTWPTTAGVNHDIFVMANSTNRADSFLSSCQQTIFAHNVASGRRWCLPGDLIRVGIRQSTGGNMTVDNNHPGSFIAIRRVV